MLTGARVGILIIILILSLTFLVGTSGCLAATANCNDTDSAAYKIGDTFTTHINDSIGGVLAALSMVYIMMLLLPKFVKVTPKGMSFGQYCIKGCEGISAGDCGMKVAFGLMIFALSIVMMVLQDKNWATVVNKCSDAGEKQEAQTFWGAMVGVNSVVVVGVILILVYGFKKHKVGVAAF